MLGIIQKGETESVEFKSSFRYDYNTRLINSDLEFEIGKSAVSFMNAKGGMVLIGVDDNKNILGIEKDYKTLGRKQNADEFLLKLSEYLNRVIGTNFNNFCSIKIESINGKEICILNCQKSDEPLFIKKNNETLFFIRSGTQCKSLNAKEQHDYTKSHWSNLP